MDKAVLMDYTEVREEVKDLRKRIQQLEREIQNLEETKVSDTVTRGKKGKKSLGTVKITGVPQTLIWKKRESLNIRKAILVKKETKLLELINEVEEYIDNIGKAELRMMFRYYYVDDLTWQQVSNRMNAAHPRRRNHYTADSCRMQHNRFLEKYEKSL